MGKIQNIPYSYHLLNASQSRKMDRETINKMGIDGFTLMEVAGSSAAKILLSGNLNLEKGVYLCGKGNNAGDALVVARYLVQHDISACVVFLSGTENLSPDAQKNLELLKKFSPDSRLTIYNSWSDFKCPVTFNFIVDGMLGTGLDSEVRDDYASAVKWANKQSVPKIAMDIPTGLHTDTGKRMGVVFNTGHTFAFGGLKIGYYLGDGPRTTGRIHLCELPFPNAYKKECSNIVIDSAWVDKPAQKAGRHKYERGVLYIIAGSEGLTGAGIMAAKSAWAEDLGAVILICPRGILTPFECQLPSIIKYPVGTRDDYRFGEKHIETVLKTIQQRPGTVLVGPGIGRNPDTVTFVNNFLDRCSADILIDADGLWCLAQKEKWSKPENSQWIITPHPGELAGFTTESLTEDYKRLNVVKKLSMEKDITILSKGMPVIVGTSNGKSYITAYDTGPFTRAGSGDVLAGKIAAYWAMGNKDLKSCLLGLLKGKHNLDTYTHQNENLPEPLDLI